MVHVRGEAIEVVVPTNHVRLEPRLGNLPRRRDLPGGASSVVELHGLRAARGGDRHSGPGRALGRNSLEMPSWAPALTAAAVLVALLWGSITFGVAGPGPRRRGQNAAGGRATDGHPGARGARSHRARTIGAPRAARAQLTARFQAFGPALAGGTYALELAEPGGRDECVRALPGGTVLYYSTSWWLRRRRTTTRWSPSGPRGRPPARPAHAATGAPDVGDRRPRRRRRRRRAVGVVVRGGAAGVPARGALLARLEREADNFGLESARPRRHRPRALRELPRPRRRKTRTTCRRSCPPIPAPASAAATPGARGASVVCRDAFRVTTSTRAA